MRSRQKGSMLVFGAGILLFLSMFAVLAVDIGRIYIVRNEMQNVADAAALAGANCLTRQSDPTSTTTCIEALAPALNWTRAEAQAQDHLDANTAANAPISSSGPGHQIQVGYWNIQTRSASGGAFSTTFTPITANDKPAVRVMVRKDTGMNDGPISMLTRLMMGAGSDVPMQAEAVAVISSPGSVFPGGLLPQAINKCMFDKYWDSATNSPRIYTGTPADPYGLSTVGEPWTLRIGSAYHYDGCDSGQWTTFDQDLNSASGVRDLINNGNPNPLNIGDLTWINPGTQTSNYNDLINKYPDLPVDVSVLVVDDVDLPDAGNSQLPIIGFAGFRITAIVGGSGKYIQGQFISSNFTPGSGVGPSFGTYTPPRLAF